MLILLPPLKYLSLIVLYLVLDVIGRPPNSSAYPPASLDRCCRSNPGSHKRRDKRCSIAAPLLRSALHTCLSAHSISIDETGSSLTPLPGPPLETLPGTESEREAEVARRIEEIECVKGGEGGEVGVFNINHLGGHRYAGVMLVSSTLLATERK